MIYWLLDLLKYLGLIEGIDRGSQLTLRMGGAALASFAIVMLLGPTMIRFLVRKKVGDRPEFDHIDLNQLTKHKSNTPTMGGILIVLAIFISVLLFANLANMYVRMALLAVLWLGVLGGFDDWLKLQNSAAKAADPSGKGRRDGLKMWEKLLFQMALAVMLSVFMYRHGGLSSINGEYPAHKFFLPLAAPLVLGAVAHAILTTLTIVGSSNAVNLTDGMDGLASGCVAVVAGVFMIVSWVAGVPEWAGKLDVPHVVGAQEMAVICASMIGSCIGFLWFNAHPAQVFMGDTGSLTLGGLLGFVAVVVRQEVVLFVAGGVFVLEALSVILQVSYFKATKPKGSSQGKRFFRCAPLHHHFHLGGWAETKVVARFWIITILLSVLALAVMRL